MIFDLTVRPDDWLLGVWWTEFAPGSGMPFPNGAHRMVFVRKIPVINDANGPDVWMVEESVRAIGESWKTGHRFEVTPRQEIERAVEARQAVFNQAPGCHGGSVSVQGGASEAARIFSSLGALPDWLSVMIIERKPAGVSEPT